jgi:beta-mannosidase
MSPQEKLTRREFVQMGGAAALVMGAPLSASALAGAEAGEPEQIKSPNARTTWDLAKLKWQVCGVTPYVWGWDKYADIHDAPDAEIRAIDAPVPGSVQKALLNAGLLADWNIGLNARDAEWVENRDWVYQSKIPDEWIQEGSQLRLRCAGLDYAGSILINAVPVLDFKGSFTPYEVDIKPHLKPSGNVLQIWFQQSPRWLGQFGYTSHIKEWKPRFNYTWDWIVRLVQIGIWDSITLDVVRDGEIGKIKCFSGAELESGTGNLKLTAATAGGKLLQVTLNQGSSVVREQTIPVSGDATEITWDRLPVEFWWPNGLGNQPLYDLHIHLLDEQKRQIDSRMLRVGFRHIEWKLTHGAAPDAHPYLCVVNGKEVFLFGIDWTPILPNFADLNEEHYRKRIALYRDLGVNIFRVWGGGFPERQWLYDLCDENGILIWQEFPLSSSGLDSVPPDDPESIRQMSEIALSYIDRRHHHASLLLWCGGNELAEDGAGYVSAHPNFTIDHHPMILRLGEVVRQNDPGRCFLPTSPYGPIGGFTPETCGKKQHWDVHGPWTFDGPVDGAWRDLWQQDDSMFHSEMGAPSASSAELIRRFKGTLPEVPGTHANPLWNRQPMWIEWPKFALEKGREPGSLEEFVGWSQKRQADALAFAVGVAKSRFPACGGIIIWMGHDCFPCTTNTSIVDFDGNPKPAAMALRDVIRKT